MGRPPRTTHQPDRRPPRRRGRRPRSRSPHLPRRRQVHRRHRVVGGTQTRRSTNPVHAARARSRSALRLDPDEQRLAPASHEGSDIVADVAVDSPLDAPTRRYRARASYGKPRRSEVWTGNDQGPHARSAVCVARVETVGSAASQQHQRPRQAVKPFNAFGGMTWTPPVSPRSWATR
jgi:hypothetical protein